MKSPKMFLPKIRAPFITMIVLIFFLSVLVAETGSVDISGKWKGQIEIPGMNLEITIDFSKDKSSEWSGSIDIPAQQARDLPLADISVDNKNVSFKISGIPGDPTFNGIVSQEGDSINGKFSQGGQTFDFYLVREEIEEAEEKTLHQNEILDRIRAFVDSTMKIWKVPGLGMAIVKDNEVILAEGFGMRSVEESLPVTSKTLFAIGSCTKAFTSAVLGVLVDEGMIDWNEKIRNYIPEFRLKDEFATQRMTVLDLVTHRSGLPRHDLVWYNSPATREELFRRLRYLEPSKDFRSVFQYQNLMFMTAGYLAGRVSGKSWENLVQEKIFDPLNMKNSNFSVDISQKSSDFALPYKEKNDKVVKIPFRNIDNVGPAGSINSNAEEMARWIIVHLNKGKYKDKQIVSEAQIVMMHTPQMVVPGPMRYDEASEVTYGMGWFIRTYRGHKLVYHGGNIDGFSALVSLLPRDGIGIAILTNLNGTPLPTIISYYAIDLLLGKKPVDWNSRIRLQQESAKKAEEKKREEEKPIKGTRPSHRLDEYAGDYENPGYGVIHIKKVGKRLIASYNSIESSLKHFHYDIFQATEGEMADAKLKFLFHTNWKGDIDKVSVPIERAVDPVVFVRKASEEMSNPEFLSKFIGKYEISGQIITVTMQGKNTLVAVVPGQPSYRLVPYKGTEFNLKDLTGFSIEFKLNKKEEVVEAIFKQPNGVFSAKKIE